MTMNCIEVQERLSNLIDNELSDAQRDQVATHLKACPTCAASVEFAKELSRAIRTLPDPTPPADLWAGIESALDEERELSLRKDPERRIWRQRPASSWVLAASIFLLATAGLWASRGLWGEHGHESMAANFDVYLAKFSVDPEKAHETLVATYDGQALTPDEAETMFGYRPVIAADGVTGAAIEQIFALDMPCCRCMLSVCRRSDGGVVTVLEHLEPQPIWFGNRSRIECLCDGKPTSVVQINGKLAASWRQGKRHITVIGVNDLEEVTRFVAGFNAPASG